MKRRWLGNAALVAALAGAIYIAPDPHPAATAGVSAARVDLVQGKGVEWWARHAVQARKDANARGRTIDGLRVALRTRVAMAPTSGLVSAFLCIHEFEGSWDDTKNPTYHGGLQMDDLFQSTYGAEFVRAWGDAYNWPPFVQLTVAMRAYLAGRGFAPWPQSSEKCGLR